MLKLLKTLLSLLLACTPLVLTPQDKATTPMPSASLRAMGLDSLWMHGQVDSLMTLGIQEMAFPGAQVLVAKEGKVIFHKTYGHHTYDSLQAVAPTDLYDLASVTKILGPLPALMKLVDEGQLDLDAPFSTYWRPWRHRKDKKDLTLREILAHQAGLKPYIVFLDEVLKKNGNTKRRFLRDRASKRFGQEAYPGIFVKDRFMRKMYRMMNRSAVDAEKKYVYSGLTFLIFPEVIAQLTGMPYDTYLQKTFYDPIGASTLGFLPVTKNHTNAIVPTEVDTLYRHALTQGWVHDENASLMGGISGNAGLFGTASDLAKMMQFYNQMGRVGDQQLISEAVVREFTTVQYPANGNRRGLGFDKPLLNNSELPLTEAYPAPGASLSSFGHSGFTGTFVWADPERQMVYVFLSNRIYPSREHRKLYQLQLRERVQHVFYEAFSKAYE